MNNGKMKIENRISINFNELIEDCTKDGKKIPKNDYLAEGRFPIIDQGQEFIQMFQQLYLVTIQEFLNI